MEARTTTCRVCGSPALHGGRRSIRPARRITWLVYTCTGCGTAFRAHAHAPPGREARPRARTAVPQEESPRRLVCANLVAGVGGSGAAPQAALAGSKLHC